MEELQNKFIPVPKWNDYYDWPPQGGMRHLIFNAETNGFKSAFKRVVRRVLVDAAVFWKIVNQQQSDEIQGGQQ